MLVRDPRFLRKFRGEQCIDVFVEHLPTKKKYVSKTFPQDLDLHFCFITGRSSGDGKIKPNSAIRTKRVERIHYSKSFSRSWLSLSTV